MLGSAAVVGEVMAKGVPGGIVVDVVGTWELG